MPRRRVVGVALLSVLAIAAILVWAERLPRTTEADSHDNLSEVLEPQMTALNQQYGAVCAEIVTSDPDGEQLSTGLVAGQHLPAEIGALTSRTSAPSNWFSQVQIDSESVVLASSGSTRTGIVAGMLVVAEAVELIRFQDAGGGNTRWEVVETQILYPCNSDGSPRTP